MNAGCNRDTPIDADTAAQQLALVAKGSLARLTAIWASIYLTAGPGVAEK